MNILLPLTLLFFLLGLIPINFYHKSLRPTPRRQLETLPLFVDNVLPYDKYPYICCKGDKFYEKV